MNPVPVKTAVKLMGKITGKVRQPLWVMSDANENKLRQVMQKYGLIKLVQGSKLTTRRASTVNWYARRLYGQGHCYWCGTMGGRIVHMMAAAPGIRLVGAVESPGHATVGKDVGKVVDSATGVSNLHITIELFLLP